MASCLCHRHLRVRQIVHLTALTIFVLQIDDAVDLVDSDALVACKAHAVYILQCLDAAELLQHHQEGHPYCKYPAASTPKVAWQAGTPFADLVQHVVYHRVTKETMD